MLGKKERCPNCGEGVSRDWNFCPYCGFSLKRTYKREEEYEKMFGLEEFDKLIEKELKEFDKLFKMDFKIPRIRLPEGSFSGISITIHEGTGIKPRVEVKTFGEMKKYEPEIKRKLGIKEGIEEIEEEREVYESPKVTEEPEAKITDLGEKYVIEITLPDVEDEENIKIVPLEQSLEIRARTKDKLYFKLIPLRGRIIKKEFKNGKLVIELEKGKNHEF